jgi:biopolymer transport protein ExbD
MDASAFASVLLAILFLLMGDLIPDRHHRAALDLPKAENVSLEPNALREDVILVSVTRDGEIYYRETRIGPEELAIRIRTALQEGAERKVYLAVDARAKNGDVNVALEQIRLAGVTSVVVLADKFQIPVI